MSNKTTTNGEKKMTKVYTTHEGEKLSIVKGCINRKSGYSLGGLKEYWSRKKGTLATLLDQMEALHGTIYVSHSEGVS